MGKLCNVGDKFYRIYKNQVLECEIIRVEKMPLGHYVYQDNIGSTTVFNRNFSRIYFKDKRLAENLVKLRIEAHGIREELDVVNRLISEVLEENRNSLDEVSYEGKE